MGDGEKIWTPCQALRLKMVNAECAVCGNRYTFPATRARAQLACPSCQEVSRRQRELAERGGWRYAVARWLDKWLLELVIASFLSDLAAWVN